MILFSWKNVIELYSFFTLQSKYNFAHLTINTLASQCLVFEKENKPFFFENASNLTHEFLYDNFNKKILLSSL